MNLTPPLRHIAATWIGKVTEPGCHKGVLRMLGDCLAMRHKPIVALSERVRGLNRGGTKMGCPGGLAATGSAQQVPHKIKHGDDDGRQDAGEPNEPEFLIHTLLIHHLPWLPAERRTGLFSHQSVAAGPEASLSRRATPSSNIVTHRPVPASLGRKLTIFNAFNITREFQLATFAGRRDLPGVAASLARKVKTNRRKS